MSTISGLNTIMGLDTLFPESPFALRFKNKEHFNVYCWELVGGNSMDNKQFRHNSL